MLEKDLEIVGIGVIISYLMYLLLTQGAGECYSNFFIQLSINISDKLCKIRGYNKLLSPMNILSCMIINDKKLTCDISTLFNDYETTIDTLNKTIKYNMLI
jgi:hypothetical protein